MIQNEEKSDLNTVVMWAIHFSFGEISNETMYPKESGELCLKKPIQHKKNLLDQRRFFLRNYFVWEGVISRERSLSFFMISSFTAWVIHFADWIFRILSEIFFASFSFTSCDMVGSFSWTRAINTFTSESRISLLSRRFARRFAAFWSRNDLFLSYTSRRFARTY